MIGDSSIAAYQAKMSWLTADTGDGPGQERPIDQVSIWQAERHVACAQGLVHAERVANSLYRFQGDAGRLRISPHSEGQGVDDHVLGRNSYLRCPPDDLASNGDPLVSVLRNALIVHRQSDHRGSMLLCQRQHSLQALLLTIDRVDDGLALIDL
jgi:hypothetical protein